MKRCMFVDDSSVIRRVARRILGSSDLLVIEASTGAEAIDICAADMPEIVVVDGALPDMASADVIRRIRAIPSPVKPLIAICLTEVDIGAIMRAKRAGAQDYILKPFNRAQLLDRFRILQAAA
jgi:two-component system chemotaxis response regulator CheY